MRELSRRQFVVHLGTLVAAACAPPPPPGQSAPPVHTTPRTGHDLLIRGGTVFDGAGADGFAADVAIDGTRITAIAPRIDAAATTVIEARGLAVAPGFIDIHSHGDGSLEDDPRSESVIRQGITTIIAGQDGGSRAPRRADGEDEDERSPLRVPTMAELLRAIDAVPPSMNVATMVGLGTVRSIVVGADNRPATPGEIARMRAMIDEALEQGACGVSSGLEYIPGAFAARDEMVELCRPLAARGLPYATHMRNEDDQLLDSIDEAVAIARGAGCPLQISHLKTQGPRNWPKIDEVLARLERERAQGLDVAFDRYPYIAYSTGLTSLFPPWSRAGGTEAFIARAKDPSTAERIRRETLAKVELIGGWQNVMITSVPRGGDEDAPGQRLDALARARGRDPYELAIELIERGRGGVGMVGFAMSEENIERFLAHPLGMVCSDGGAFALDGPTRRGHPHPRGIGSFPRVLGRYVRERRALSLPQAIHKMTAFPAARVRLLDRGRLAPGLAADITVFDPATVADRATFEAPFAYPDGIHAVIVNGSLALRDGVRSERRSGRALRP